jgi:fermentation-respiration switch protein FrsA (DUF1100 family)
MANLSATDSDSTAAPSRRLLAYYSRRLLLPIAAVYLVIVLGMMFIETWLVYPIPPLTWGNWQPTTFNFEEVNFTSADGTRLHGWFVEHPNPVRAILYCHGNGENVALDGPFVADLSKALEASVFVFDYRGYGKSEGSPNEAGCIADGSAAQKWLADKMRIGKARVVVWGRSLGSGVATALAAQNGARALILESAFPSMPDVAALHYPWLPVRWIMKNRYDNVSRIKSYKGFVFQCHGANDTLIPIHLAKTLYEAIPGPKQWHQYEGGHNDPLPPSYYRLLADRLATIP